MPVREAISTGPTRFLIRTCTILRTKGWGVLVGERNGRDERSSIPALPICAYRRAHFAAVGYDTLKNLAASATDQPLHHETTNPSTMHGRQSSISVRHENLRVQSGELDSPTLPGGSPH